MYLNKEIDEVIYTLRDTDELKEISFLKAFPYVTKPTRLSKRCAVLSPNSLELESISVDNTDFYGTGEIRIDLFCPYHLGSPVIFDDMQKIVKASLNDEISKISISAISMDSAAECYVLTAVLGFGHYEKTEEF